MSNVEAVKKYQANRDSIMLRPSKDEGQAIRAAAAAVGMSVQAYVLRAVRAWMERERDGAVPGDMSAGGAGDKPPEPEWGTKEWFQWIKEDSERKKQAQQ